MTVRDDEAPTVVVIDDDQSVREALQGLLQSVGLRVALFSSVRQFLDSNRMPSWLPCSRCEVAREKRVGFS